MKGKIYMIKSKQTDKVYIGSTIKTLNIRFRGHKTLKDCTSQEILKYSDAKIELIECYECENKEQLTRREGEYIKKYNCVNERIAGRTRQEHYQENKEELLQKKKEYREKNKEVINEKAKEYYQENKEVINEKKKDHYQENREEVLKKAKEKFTCECSGKYILSHKSRHFKSKKHLEFLTKQN